MIRILIADDHRLVIDGIRLMLESAEDMECTGEAYNGKEALSLLEKVPADVLLLDISMPEMDGLECSRIVKSRFPEVKILVLSMFKEAALVKSMLRHGASGFLLKNAGKDEVIEAIRQVYAGKQALSAEILEMVADSFASRAAKPVANPFPRLSRREKQILQLIAEEKTTSEIAEALFISFGTVETHRRNILAKLNARNTAGLIKTALQYGLIE
ncbi:MAG: response regulator [Saprospiraceae bacterium]